MFIFIRKQQPERDQDYANKTIPFHSADGVTGAAMRPNNF